MHPLLLFALAPMLAVPGLGDPAVTETLPADPTDEAVGANATVQARAGATNVSVDLSDEHLFYQAALPGPGISRPAEDVNAEAGTSVDPGGESSSSASAVPVPLPTPEETAIPAGLAVLGAAAWAAWRYLIPGVLPLYSRLSKGDLLDNETRADLVEAIEAEPGLSQQELCDKVDAGWGNTVYHLQRLEQAGFVRSEKQGHHRRFYRAGEIQNEEIEALGVLKNDNANKIARYLIEEPGANQKQVCQALDISPSLAHKWIKRLEENDLVESEREWRSKHYTPDDRLDELVQAI